MKAHIQTEPRTVLLWRFGPGAAGYDALERAARSYRLTIRPVDESLLSATIGDLCAGLARTGDPLPAPTERAAMIVSGLRRDNGDLNAFLDEIKRAGAVIPLRAMVTPTSRGWTLGQLLGELGAEHDALEGGK